jgi:NAD(P)-dependent dehydrogenase (short-subunit alcohol dehydrogenase family)
MGQLEGKIAVVTGASRGIGLRSRYVAGWQAASVLFRGRPRSGNPGTMTA